MKVNKFKDYDTLSRALFLACQRIADGPQTYSEADTPEGWFEVFMEQACGKCKALNRDGIGPCDEHYKG